MSIKEKQDFLKEQLPQLFSTLNAVAKGKWGVLNAQQMVEHLSDAVREANGKTPKKILTASDVLPRAKAFMMSDKPFKENTKNAEMSEVPAAVKQPSIQAALAELQNEIKDFFIVFEKEPAKIITNPFFGDLNFDEWTHLLYKHTTHHCRQFELIE